MATVRINGVAYDHGSHIIRINGVIYEGIQAIKYSQKRSRAKNMGQGRSGRPKGWTKGKYSAEDGSITMDKQDAARLRTDLATKAGNGCYGDAVFPITVQAVEDGLPSLNDELFECVYLGDDGGTDVSSEDPSKEEIPFGCQYIKRDGKTLYTADRS